MAPPDRDDHPRRPENIDYLEKSNLAGNPVLGKNAARLASWVEWLLHPEEHEYDRTVIYGDSGRKEDVEHPTRDPNVPPDYRGPVPYLDYESVIEGYYMWQFMNFMTAVSTQEVESSDSALAPAAVTIDRLYFVAATYEQSLKEDFPEQKWQGGAATAAKNFLDVLSPAATRISKVAGDLRVLIPKYALIIKELRRDLDRAAGELAHTFDYKFYDRPGGISIDVEGVIVAGIVGGAVAAVTLGAGAPIAEAAIASAWTAMFSDAASDLRKEGQGAVSGTAWRDLAGSYFLMQERVMTAATRQIRDINKEIIRLQQELDNVPMPTKRIPGAGK